jgi:hypothetical protein
MEAHCTLCRLPVDEPCLAVVEVTRSGALVRKALFYGLHCNCGDDWSQSEIERMRRLYGDRSDLKFARRVEVVREPPWAGGVLSGREPEPWS